MSKATWKIVTSPDELTEGLFGQIFGYIFEILPYLNENSIYPSWDIKSKLYGTYPDFTVIPGVFDLAYISDEKNCKNITLQTLRDNHTCILGNDWYYLHKLWHLYFRVPERIINQSNQIALEQNSLGIHYRGNDKNHSSWDTNPVFQEDFLTLIQDFIKNHQDIRMIFIATDEFSFVEKAMNYFSDIKIINLGEVSFHKSSNNVLQKGDRAMLDCVLLSQCKYSLQCSSALSGFAKVLNPELESYRVSASKLFCDNPYFPVAYIQKLTTVDKKCSEILEKQFKNDWSDSLYARLRFGRSFKTKSRYIHLIKIANRVKFKPLIKLKRWIKGL